MLTSLVYLQKGQKVKRSSVKKSKYFMKITDTDEENLHIFQTTCRISMKFSENVLNEMHLMILLKVIKNHGFTISLDKKTQG